MLNMCVFSFKFFVRTSLAESSVIGETTHRPLRIFYFYQIQLFNKTLNDLCLYIIYIFFFIAYTLSKFDLKKLKYTVKRRICRGFGWWFYAFGSVEICEKSERQNWSGAWLPRLNPLSALYRVVFITRNKSLKGIMRCKWPVPLEKIVYSFVGP